MFGEISLWFQERSHTQRLEFNSWFAGKIWLQKRLEVWGSTVIKLEHDSKLGLLSWKPYILAAVKLNSKKGWQQAVYTSVCIIQTDVWCITRLSWLFLLYRGMDHDFKLNALQCLFFFLVSCRMWHEEQNYDADRTRRWKSKCL